MSSFFLLFPESAGGDTVYVPLTQALSVSVTAQTKTVQVEPTEFEIATSDNDRTVAIDGNPLTITVGRGNFQVGI